MVGRYSSLTKSVPSIWPVDVQKRWNFSSLSPYLSVSVRHVLWLSSSIIQASRLVNNEAAQRARGAYWLVIVSGTGIHSRGLFEWYCDVRKSRRVDLIRPCGLSLRRDLSSPYGKRQRQFVTLAGIMVSSIRHKLNKRQPGHRTTKREILQSWPDLISWRSLISPVHYARDYSAASLSSPPCCRPVSSRRLDPRTALSF